MAARDYGQYDGVTRAVELVGERWALLIVRNLLVGPRRYGELAAGLPRIPSNILAGRLKELQACGVIRRAPRSRVVVYELTAYGRELEPIVLALDAWGARALGEMRREQVITPEAMTVSLRSAFRPHAASLLPATSYGAHLDTARLRIVVHGGTLDVARSEDPVDLAFVAGPGLHKLLVGQVDPDSAVASGAIDVVSGPSELLGRFAETFRLAA